MIMRFFRIDAVPESSMNLNHHEKVKFSVSDCLPFGHGYDSTHNVTVNSCAPSVELSRAATNMGFSE
jgi:hypothetical protein